MKGRPLSIIVVSILFMITGIAGFIYHIKDFAEPGAKPLEITGVLMLELLAILCALLLIFRIAWARWLAIAWLALHVIISSLNSMSETIQHLVILVIVSVLLFLPVSSAYFRNKT